MTLLLGSGLALGVEGNTLSRDTLVVWTINNGVGAQGSLKSMMRSFRKETGTPVRILVLDWGDAFEKISKALLDSTEMDNAPDLVQLGSTWVAYFASAGALRPLNHVARKIDFGRFLEVGMKASHLEGDSVIYAAPWFMDVRGLFVNERLWRELNVNESNVDSISTFMGTLRAIGKSDLKNGLGKVVTPFALPSKGDWAGSQQMAPFIWSFGGDFVACDTLGCHSGILDSNFLKGFAVYASLMGDHDIAPNSLLDNTAQNTDRFVMSEQLMVYGTSELIRKLEFFPSEGGLRTMPISDDGIMTIPFAGGPAGKAAFVGGSHLALTRRGNASRHAQAEKLLVYLLRADNMDAYSRKIGFLPSDQGLVRVWLKDIRYTQLVNNLDRGRTFPNIPEWGVIESTLNSLSGEVGAVLSKEKDVNACNRSIAALLIKTDRAVNEILKAVPDSASRSKPSLEEIVKCLSDIPKEIAPTNLKLSTVSVSHARDHEGVIVRCLIGLVFVMVVVRSIIRRRSRRKRK